MKSCPNCHQPLADSDASCKFCSYILAASSAAAAPVLVERETAAPAEAAAAPHVLDPGAGAKATPASAAARNRKTAIMAVAAVGILGTLTILMLPGSSRATRQGTSSPAASNHGVMLQSAATAPLLPGAKGQVNEPMEFSSKTSTAHPKWTTGRERVWGRSNVKFELAAEQDVPVWKKNIRPVLTVRCLGNKTEVFVMTFSPASIEPNGSMHTVTVAFDGGPELTQQWEHSDDHSALFAEDGVQLARRLGNARKMTFEFSPFNAAPVTAEFDVTGFDAHLKSVAKTCSWK